MTWQDGASNGGTAIVDYEIWYDQATDDYVSLVTGLTERHYTVAGLYSGSTYTFKVRARNAVGYGEFSTELSVLAAQKPDIPLAPTTSISDRWDVIIDWTAPYDGGSAILSYTVELRTTDVTVFSIDATNCDGADETILANT